MFDAVQLGALWKAAERVLLQFVFGEGDRARCVTFIGTLGFLREEFPFSTA
jgi:hypothetical protein